MFSNRAACNIVRVVNTHFLNFHELSKIVWVGNTPYFFFRPPHTRQIRFRHFIFSLILCQYSYISSQNLSQLDHAISVVVAQYILMPKINITTSENRNSYLVFKRSGELGNANGGVCWWSFPIRHSSDVILESIVFCLWRLSGSRTCPSREHTTYLEPSIF